MDIEDLLVLETKIVQKRVVFKFTYTEISITELRTLKTVELMESVLKSLRKKEVTNVCFVFVINSLEMTTNIKLFEQFASIFRSYTDVIKQKLDFTIIQTNNGIFKLFFSLFKMYYEPIKPLYMCHTKESVEKCLTSSSERNKISDLSEKIIKDSKC